MSSLAFSHVGISCMNMSVTEEFYSKHFGFQRARVLGEGADQIIFLKTESGDAYLELFQADAVSQVVMPATGVGPSKPGFRHLAFAVDDVDAKLGEMGTEAHITEGPDDFDDVIPGWRVVWISDPDGRILELSQGYVDQENPPAFNW